MSRGKKKPAKEKRPPGWRRERFIAEYVIDLNGTQAAIRAGYSAATANEQAAQLLANVSIREAIAVAQKAHLEKLGVKAESVLSEMANLAYSDIGDILDFTGESPTLRPANQISARARRCISSVKIKRYVEGKEEDAKTVEVMEFKLWDKPGKIADLAKHLKLLTDEKNVKHTGIVNLQIVERVLHASDGKPAGKADGPAADHGPASSPA